MMTKLNMITKFNFNIFHNQSDSEKKGLNSLLIYIGSIITAAFSLHLYIIYVFKGNLLIFTIIDSLILLLLFFFKS